MVALGLQAVQVVIVGAGLSGLRAATEVHNAGLSYVVLEARDRVGGRTLSQPASANGTTGLVELGAAWINNSTQTHMFALAKDFGFDLIVQRTKGMSLAEDTSGKIKNITFGSYEQVGSLPICTLTLHPISNSHCKVYTGGTR